MNLLDTLHATIAEKPAEISVISWTAEPEYAPGTAGKYTFTPVLEIGYTLEDVSLPTVPVTVLASQEENDGQKEASVVITIDPDEPLYLGEGELVTDADLLAGVTAEDENGASVDVTVQSVDGLDRENPTPKDGFEAYSITYEAKHPASEEVFTVTREAYVTVGIMPLDSTWGDGGVIDLSALPANDEAGTAPNTPWSWDSAAQVLTLTGPGPYTIEGTADETACIVAVLNGNMEIEINGDLKAPPLASGYDSHPALKATGTGDLSLTGTGSLIGGTHQYWAGHGVRASELNGNVFISGSLQITGGYGNCGDIGVRLSENDLTLSGTVTLTGGDSGSAALGCHGVYHDTSSYGNVFISGQIEMTGGNVSLGNQNRVAIGGTGVGTILIHFTNPDASLTAKNGQAVTTATARNFVNDTLNTRWDINASAIAGGKTVYEQTITVNSQRGLSLLGRILKKEL